MCYGYGRRWEHLGCAVAVFVLVEARTRYRPSDMVDPTPRVSPEDLRRLFGDVWLDWRDNGSLPLAAAFHFQTWSSAWPGLIMASCQRDGYSVISDRLELPQRVLEAEVYNSHPCFRTCLLGFQPRPVGRDPRSGRGTEPTKLRRLSAAAWESIRSVLLDFKFDPVEFCRLLSDAGQN